MNDLLTRLLAIEEILYQSMPGKEAIISSLQKLSGLNLTILTPSIRKTLEDNLVNINQILQQYDLKTWDDYDKISIEHVRTLFSSLLLLCQTLLLRLETDK